MLTMAEKPRKVHEVFCPDCNGRVPYRGAKALSGQFYCRRHWLLRSAELLRMEAEQNCSETFATPEPHSEN